MMKFRVIASIALLGIILGSCASISENKPEIEENNPEGPYQKALIASNYGLADEAINYLQEALSLDPGHFPSYYLLGVTFQKQGNLSEARTAFEKCVELEPGMADTHARLGSIYQELEMENEAENEYEQAFNIDQSFISSFNLAQFNFRRDNLDLALKYVQSAVEKNNASGPAYNLQGVIFNRMKRYPEAIVSFLNALKIDANDSIAGVNLGVAYINNKEYDKARNLLSEILSSTQDSSLKEKINEYLKAIKNIRS